MDQLAGLLNRERLQVEKLLFKLVELRQLLATGEARFLPWAAEEVDRATARLRDSELHRAVVVNRLAGLAGVDECELSLRTLADTTPEPYGSIFADHRRAFLELTAEITDALAECHVFAAQGAAFVAEVLERVHLESEPGPADRPTAGHTVVLATT